MVFDIQRYALHDGEGIRTLVFFKGCPLRCDWCSNPESQEFGAELMYDPERCKDFADCLAASPDSISRHSGHGIQINRSGVAHPELLKDICASGALAVSGNSMTTDEIVSEVSKDISFYRNDGGVTLSGGEPLAQGADLVTLLEALNQLNIRVNMETSLHVSWKNISRCLGLVDTFLVDLKHVDLVKFRARARGDALLVMDNLDQLTQLAQRVIIRIPVIPGFNHSGFEMEKILNYAATLQGVKEVHFLPYHTLGKKKYRMLGRKYPCEELPAVNTSELLPYLEVARQKGLEPIIGG